ncbi:MAG: YebC/PmpR family DNA-binding transcriptional regulator, partial [Clostridia bacterium]|nr:YebC/PmpR family DNA-binding transcriptional regulator [Clostridia bacterium]
FIALDDVFEVYTAPADFSMVREGLENLGYQFVSAEISQIPKNTTNIEDPETIEKIERFLERLDDNDDVQEVFHNGVWKEKE